MRSDLIMIFICVGIFALMTGVSLKKGLALKRLKRRCTEPVAATVTNMIKFRPIGRKHPVWTAEYRIYYNGMELDLYNDQIFSGTRPRELHIGNTVEIMVDPNAPGNFFDEIARRALISYMMSAVFGIIIGAMMLWNLLSFYRMVSIPWL